MNTHFITTEHLSLDKLQEIFKNGYKIELSEQAKTILLNVVLILTINKNS